MDKFEYATMGIPCNAWDDSGRKNSALTDFSKAIQGKPVSKVGIASALRGLDIWDCENSTVDEVEIDQFYPQTGKAVAYLGNRGSTRHVKVTIKWDPEKGVVKAESKSASNANLEKRVAALEAQVMLLTELLSKK